jgi:hypothetical protein
MIPVRLTLAEVRLRHGRPCFRLMNLLPKAKQFGVPDGKTLRRFATWCWGPTFVGSHRLAPAYLHSSVVAMSRFRVHIGRKETLCRADERPQQERFIFGSFSARIGRGRWGVGTNNQQPLRGI